MDNTSKFRKSALQQFTSPEQLDQLIRVVTRPSWIIACTFYAIIFIALLWSIFGSIPTKAEGIGILLAGGGDIYNAVAPDGPSQISALLVKPGDHVEKGQVVATLARPDLQDQIKDSQNYLRELNDIQTRLKNISVQEIATRQQQLNDQKQSLQRVLAASNEKFTHLSAFLALRQDAFKKGIETRENVEQTLQEYYNIKSEIEGYSNKLIQIDIDQANFVDQWRERIRELEIKITDENLKLSDLVGRVKLSSDVSSPISGTVTDIQAAVGSIVNTGAPLVSIASEGNGLDALVFVQPEFGKRIKVDMDALISPTTVERSEFGSLKGKVIAVSTFPSSSEAILATLQNQVLVKEFTQEKAPIAIRVRITPDANTFSGLQWTSSKGPKQRITPGTIVHAMVTIHKQAPITLLIPMLKKLAGVD